MLAYYHPCNPVYNRVVFHPLSFFWVALFLQLPYVAMFHELRVLTFNVIMNRTHFFGGSTKMVQKNVIKIRVILAS